MSVSGNVVCCQASLTVYLCVVSSNTVKKVGVNLKWNEITHSLYQIKYQHIQWAIKSLQCLYLDLHLTLGRHIRIQEFSDIRLLFCRCPDDTTGDKCQVSCANYECKNHGKCFLANGTQYCRYVLPVYLFLILLCGWRQTKEKSISKVVYIEIEGGNHYRIYARP